MLSYFAAYRAETEDSTTPLCSGAFFPHLTGVSRIFGMNSIGPTYLANYFVAEPQRRGQHI